MNTAVVPSNQPKGPKRRIQIRLDAPLHLNDLAAITSTITPFDALSQFIDPNGKLHFAGKACIDSQGVDFKNGTSYRINMTEFTLVKILGKGQYGVVQLVHHNPTNVKMALKEIMLELDELKMNQITMELQILHASHHPNIIDFYGAFFIESCVYMCIEYMDGGSLDKLYSGGIPEPILREITLAVVQGLHFLKSSLSIIHRDVKPTNILVNTLGQIKLCDFGVSGQLVQSLAKTNIGCQSYMAPERIASRSTGKYSARSDVWSVGITIVELGVGAYPFPWDKFDSVFAQLSAIVSSDAPTLPVESFSEDARNFISKCLEKDPQARPTYPELLLAPWLTQCKTDVDVGAWVKQALEKRAS
ncbi:hypothetical protein BDV3_003777 [Batrachochytrium dendrobatidis]